MTNLVHEWRTIYVDGEAVDVSFDAVKRDGVRIVASYREAEDIARILGGELPTPRVLDARWEVSELKNLPHPGNVLTRTAEQHSADVDLDVLHWQQEQSIPSRLPNLVGQAGKPWVRGADGWPLYGWFVPPAQITHRAGMSTWRGIRLHPPSSELTRSMVIQPYAPFAHPGGIHRDYSSTVILMRRPGSTRPSRDETPTAPPSGNGRLSADVAPRTIRRGDHGPGVAEIQRKLGVKPDGIFGGVTELAVRGFQSTRGLLADGIVGPITRAALGSSATVPPPSSAVSDAKSNARTGPAAVGGGGGSLDPRAPACVAALRDANARWPTRKRASDGILGDARHQASVSDHNLGNAVDITHDPESGCTGDVLAAMAIDDARVTYVIWNRRIYNRARAAEGWRRYTGANPHHHHVHISVRVDRRNDASAWPWAP